METLNKVTEKLYQMFIENTGSHMCDSGGAYGRNHERNAKLSINDFLNKPTVYVEKSTEAKTTADLYYTVDAFKYLNECNLEFDAICDEFNKINSNSNNWDYENMYGVSTEAGEYLDSVSESIKEPWNTYNDSYSNLSQVLQGCYCVINDENYLLLQVHGGCDVRGGYTNTVMFKMKGECLPFYDVLGSVITGKKSINVNNSYNGYSLTDESGNNVKLSKTSKVEVELYVMEY